MSSTSSTSSTSSNMLRITGLATGLDTDSIVKQMMKAENVKLDKVKQDKQTIQWKQDLYRDITNDLVSFKTTYFNVVNSSSNMLSSNNFASFDVTSSDSTNSIATATGGSGAAAGTYGITNITIATKANYKGNAQQKLKEAGTSASLSITKDVNDTMNININGVITPITLASDVTYNNINDLVTQINSKLNTANIDSNLIAQASIDGTRIQFKNVSADTSTQISITGNSLNTLGFSSSGFDVYASNNDRISSLFSSDTDAKVSFTLNNKSFSYDFSSTGVDKDKTISQVISEISSKAGVDFKYSELGSIFSIESLNTGATEAISTADLSGSFLSTLFGAGVSTQGHDATATIKDPSNNTSTIKRSANSFTIDGVKYNLLKNDTSTDGVSLTLTANPKNVYDKIKTFIDKYNETIDKINTKISEKKQYDYLPLTDDQKAAMSDDDIKKWEEKAKQGLLKNDSSLQSMVTSFRSSFYASVKDSGITLSEIGLSTSSDTTQRGKIIIDETKLKDAIQNKGKQVSDLFTKTSSSNPTYNPDMSIADRNTRTNEEGIFQRLSDALQDNIRTTRSASGRKGSLIEKAGLVGDFTEYNNLLTNQLNSKDTLIKNISATLQKKETSYYNKFSKLETAMNKMNSQSTWLTQQFSAISGK